MAPKTIRYDVNVRLCDLMITELSNETMCICPALYEDGGNQIKISAYIQIQLLACTSCGTFNAIFI